MFDTLPATRPEGRHAALPLLYAVSAHAALMLLLVAVPALVAITPLTPPPVPVRFFSTPAAAPPREAVGGEGGEASRRARLFPRLPDHSPSDPRRIHVAAPSGPGIAALAPPAPPDEGKSGIPSLLAEPRRPPRPRDGARAGAAAGAQQGDLAGVEGGSGRAIGSDFVLEVGGDVKAPQVLEQVRPEYPPQALLEHTEGIVVLTAIIDDQGAVDEVCAVSGPIPLRAPAVAALKRWRFEPGTLNGKPVRVSFTLTVRFVIRPPEPEPEPIDRAGFRL